MTECSIRVGNLKKISYFNHRAHSKDVKTLFEWAFFISTKYNDQARLLEHQATYPTQARHTRQIFAFLVRYHFFILQEEFEVGGMENAILH